MTASALFRIGARGSPLSRAQVALLRARMAAIFEIAPERIEFLPITTSGDRIQDRSLVESGGKGLFTKELDEALLDGRIDLALHSMKDLPAELPASLALAAVPAREDCRDAFISKAFASFADLPDGAVLGTASVRRGAQALRAKQGRLRVELLRGNVETRLRKLDEGHVQATFLAYAGLKRLGLEAHARALLDPREMPPAACQGALAVTTRADDAQRFASLDDSRARIETSAERAFLAALDGSCRTPLGALSKLENGKLAFLGEVLRPDGSESWRKEETIDLGADPRAAAAALGARIGAELRAIGVREGVFTS
ncbi:MAG: hydroxymethylbilane synthase [Hyphomonadaceae bacterium]